MDQEINNIIVHSISMGKLFTKHILRLLWKMVGNMFFLDSEYEGWGDAPLQNLLAFDTPSGRYRLKRLQYWIHSSSDPANISTSVPRCFWVDMTSRRRTTSNQRWNNVVYVNVEIYNVEQRWNNVVFFNVELNNVRQRRNNVVIFNVDFHNVGQRRNNVANMTIWKKI